MLYGRFSQILLFVIRFENFSIRIPLLISILPVLSTGDNKRKHGKEGGCLEALLCVLHSLATTLPRMAVEPLVPGGPFHCVLNKACACAMHFAILYPAILQDEVYLKVRFNGSLFANHYKCLFIRTGSEP